MFGYKVISPNLWNKFFLFECEVLTLTVYRQGRITKTANSGILPAFSDYKAPHLDIKNGSLKLYKTPLSGFVLVILFWILLAQSFPLIIYSICN